MASDPAVQTNIRKDLIFNIESSQPSMIQKYGITTSPKGDENKLDYSLDDETEHQHEDISESVVHFKSTTSQAKS